MVGQIVAKDALTMLGGRNISGDLTTVTVSRMVETPESTTHGSNTRQRLPGGIKDWSVALTGLFNDNTGALEQQMDSLMGGSGIIGVFPHGPSSACCAGYEGVSLESEYSIESPVDGVVSLTATWSGSGDCDRTILLMPLSACSTNGSVASSSYDYGGSRAGTLTGYLRCTAASGTEELLDVIIQHSADDSAWTNLITFTQVTAGSVVERKEVTSASQYVRAKITIAGSADSEFTLMASMG